MKKSFIVAGAVLIATVSAASAFEPKKGNGDQGVVVTSFSAGLSDPNGQVPTLDGVPGAGVHNWDIATPKGVLLNGSLYVYQMTFQSISYSGNCKATYKLTQKQGKKNIVIDSGTIADTFDCTSPTNWAFAITGNKAISAPAGPATLTGTLTLTGGKVVVETPVTIQ